MTVPLHNHRFCPPMPVSLPNHRFSPLLELAVAANVAAIRRLAKGGFTPPATYLTLLAQAAEVMTGEGGVWQL